MASINEFAERVAAIEGKKRQVNIAQIKEILKTINTLTGGILYRLIQIMK